MGGGFTTKTLYGGQAETFKAEFSFSSNYSMATCSFK